MVPCQDAPALGPGSVPWASGQWLPGLQRPHQPSSSSPSGPTLACGFTTLISRLLYWAGSASAGHPGLARCLAPPKEQDSRARRGRACWSPGTSDTANLTSQPSTTSRLLQRHDTQVHRKIQRLIHSCPKLETASDCSPAGGHALAATCSAAKGTTVHSTDVWMDPRRKHGHAAGQ